MSNSISSSRALPVVYVVLRVLIVLNWLYGAAILAVLVVSIANEQWFITAMKLSPMTDVSRAVMGMRGIALLGVATIPPNYILLKRLLSIVDTLRAGDPFVAANANRLKTIGWMLLALNVVSIVIGGIATAVSTRVNPIHLDSGFSLSGWLAVLFTFVLARVFAEGANMREDLEGTV